MITRDNILTTEQAFSYLVDCTLATVCALAMKKSRSKGEFKRQTSMAQTGVNWIFVMGIDCKGSRAEEVIQLYGQSVSAWAEGKFPN